MRSRWLKGCLAVATLYMLCSILGRLIPRSSTESERLSLTSKEKASAPIDAIPFFFRQFCQFLEDEIAGSEGVLRDANAEKKYDLRGLLVLTRHGERSPLTDDLNILRSFSCTPYHEADRVAFKKYKQFVESTAFKSYLTLSPTFSHGFSILPDSSKCIGREMTAEGVLQMHKLGTYLFDRYHNSSLFKGDVKLTVISSLYNRTLQSAIGLASGFLYPQRNVTGNLKIQSSNATYICAEDEDECFCKFGLAIRQKYEDEMTAFFNQNQAALREECAVFQKLAATARDDDPLLFLDKMMGFYVCRRQHLPCSSDGYCASYKILSKLIEAATERSRAMFEHETARSLTAPRLQLLEAHSIMRKVVRIAASLRRFPRTTEIAVLSSHDVSLESLLLALSILPQTPPRYASRVVVEFYASGEHDDVFARLLYNGVDQTAKLKFCRQLVDGLCRGSAFEAFLADEFWRIHPSLSTFQSLCTAP